MQTSWLATSIAFELQNTDYQMKATTSGDRRKEDVQATEIQAVGEALVPHAGDICNSYSNH